MTEIASILPGESPAGSTELRDWLTLLKPRVVSLVVFTGAIGLLVAPVPLNPVLAIAAVLCIAVAAGAAGAINMWFDRDIDAVMHRTANRPIPGGRIDAPSVLGFGVVLAVASVLMMYLATNTAAAVWLAVSILFYVVIYTMWLKRRTPQNIVIGGAAGAFPPIIGWVAATGSVDVLPLLMFAIIFFWTPPHFWALSLYASGDYARAGVPMLPVVAGPRSTRWHVFAYTLVLVATSLTPTVLGYAGLTYGIAASILGAVFIYGAVTIVLDEQDKDGLSRTKNKPAKWTFKYSLLYLFLLFFVLAIDHFI